MRIFQKEAVTLAQSGYEVHLVAPSAKDQSVQGVQVHAVPRNNGRRRRMTRTALDVYRRGRSLGADVYHFHDPELIPFGFWLKLQGRRVIYDAHEDLPKDIQDKAWIKPWLRWPVASIAGGVEWFVARFLDRVVAATPSISRRFPKRKTSVVQNFPEKDSLWSSEAVNYQLRAPLVAYVGGIADIRGAREMVEAIGMVPDQLGVRLGIAGEWESDELLNEVGTLPGWSRVERLGTLSRAGVRDLLAKSRIGILLYHPLANHIEAQPTKLYEYMSAEIPIVASNFPLWKKIVEDAGCGLTVDPMDCEAVAAAIQWLLEHPGEAAEMGRRGREAVLKHYNWEQQADVLRSTYRELLKG